jgi:hypothetical protein
LLREHERFVDQRGEMREHIEIAANGFGSIERKARAEDREASQQNLLVGGEQAIAPVDGLANGAMTRQRARSRGEQTERVIEA